MVKAALLMQTLLIFFSLLAPNLSAADRYAELIPQHLLGLMHAPEVHKELKLSDAQVASLEALFQEIDGTWFRARIKPAEQQREIISQLEARVRQLVMRIGTREQLRRLTQLEYRAQGTRMLLRDDLGRMIGIQPEQRQKLVDLATAVDKATKDLQTATMKNEPTGSLQATLSQLSRAEQSAPQTLLNQQQFRKLSQLIGSPFDTSKLSRIYPMAPELESVQHWINSRPLTLKQLRGKVVLLHFYAFQCHNCHANFGHYQSWHEKYGDQVVVLGIQSPETSRERDPEAVKEAARKRGLTFPIMVDLEMTNWKSWANTMWPTVYVIDQDGYIRLWWQGELNWKGATGDDKVEEMVDRLLKRPWVHRSWHGNTK
jgi:peroxiredoxin